MNNKYLRPLFTVICISLLFNSLLYGQWKPTRGLYSGSIHSVIYSNNELIVGANYIYKSSDGGKIWNISNNGISGTVNSIRGLVKINSNLVAVTNTGAFYSNDNGNNWVLCSGTASLDCWSVIVKGTNVFLSTSDNGVYKSTNSGVNWSAANTGINTSVEHRCFAIRGTDLYVGSDGYGIYRSTNDGTSWSTVNTGLPGSYYSVSSLAVVGTTIIAGTYGAGVYKSTNGTSWSAINNGVSSTDDIMGMGVNGNSIYASTLTGNLFKTTDYTNWSSVAVGPYMTTRYEAFYSTGSDFYVGTWGAASGEKSFGVFKTTDDGNTWKHVGITEFPVSAIEISGTNILAGTDDISGNSARITLFKTSETDSVWNYNLGGFAGSNITALKANGAVVYLFDDEGPGNSLVYRSSNNGNNWTSTGFNVLYSNFTTFAIAGSIIYAGENSSKTVVVSSDNGATWSSVITGLPSAVSNINALLLKGTLLFAATNNGVYKNTVGSNNWTSVSSGLTNLIIKSLSLSGTTLFAGTQGSGIFKSVNDGGTWTDANTGIPLYTNVTCFTTFGTTVFAGTDNGVFSSSNNGALWNNINTGLIDTSITAINVSNNYLWAGTTGHGVWKRQLSQIITGVDASTENSELIIYPNPADAYIHIRVTEEFLNNRSVLTIFDVTGRALLENYINHVEVDLNIGNLSSGVYYFNLKNSSASKTLKFIKK